jgi:hypothetical protein
MRFHATEQSFCNCFAEFNCNLSGNQVAVEGQGFLSLHSSLQRERERETFLQLAAAGQDAGKPQRR